MGFFKDAEDAENRFFKDDLFAADNGMKIDFLNEETCICSMELEDRHRNAAGAVMGGVIFTLADLAFAATANNLHSLTVTQQVSINYLNPSKGSVLTAQTHILKNARTSSVVRVDVTDDTGTLIAQYVGVGAKIGS